MTHALFEPIDLNHFRVRLAPDLRQLRRRHDARSLGVPLTAGRQPLRAEELRYLQLAGGLAFARREGLDQLRRLLLNDV